MIIASYTGAFQAKYPFYDLTAGEGLWPNMAMWWVVYGLQFMALEFFFRGFMVHGLKHRLGYMAIFVMVVPYNMLHFNKPVLEAVAAIGGAIVLARSRCGVVRCGGEPGFTSRSLPPWILLHSLTRGSCSDGWQARDRGGTRWLDGRRLGLARPRDRRYSVVDGGWAVVGGLNGLISGAVGLYGWHRGKGWLFFVLDSTWVCWGTCWLWFCTSSTTLAAILST